VLKRMVAIALIFVCTSIAWAILGATVFDRTYSADRELKERVVSTWGAPQVQPPPTATYQETVTHTQEAIEGGQKVARVTREEVTRWLPLDGSRIDVRLELAHRQKGLLWYSTYKVAFRGGYRFTNPGNRDLAVTFSLKYPAARAIYDDLTFLLDEKPLAVVNLKSDAVASAVIPAGKTAVLTVAYHSHGLDTWRYEFGSDVSQVRDFQLRMTTNFKAIDFPENTLSPTDKRETSDGWELAWVYKNLVTGFQIGMVLPEKLQPGPLVGRISLFAPVSLFFFFFLMLIITTMRGVELHPMNYFFLAAAFFAFHLLLAYAVDHISIHAAFVISSAVSVFLVVSYLRLVVGMRFAAVEAGVTQLIYLILFSYAFFFKGFTGLTITIGSILTLFVVMQMTGRIPWAEKFAGKPA